MQKKILLAVIVCTIVTTVDAQIKKGAVLLGGQLGFSSNKNDNNLATPPAPVKSTVINFSPAIGKAIKDNLIIGVDISYIYSKYINYNPLQQKSSSYGIGFFVRKYKDLGKGFYFFGQARAGGSYIRQEYDNIQQQPLNTLSKGYSVQLAVYPGVAYSISKKFQLEAGFNDLGYLEFDHSRLTAIPASGTLDATNGFSFGSRLSNFSGITLGFRILLD